jgi:hypothetical protein
MTKPIAILDLEVYRDYFLVAMRQLDGGKVGYVEMFEGQPLDVAKVRQTLKTHRIVTFNGNHFDLPLLAIALSDGATPALVKKYCDLIITGGLKPWDIYREAEVQALPVDHVDLFEVAPGKVSLKVYGGRLHCQKMQDLPIDPDESIGEKDRELIRTYCANDLAVTEALYRALEPQINLREEMGQRYGVDLRSKSDAQIAEAVIVHEVGRVRRPSIAAGTVYKYPAPAWLHFSRADLQSVLADVLAADFVVQDTGGIAMPEALAGREIAIGASVYRLGIGGLHSSEECTAHIADADTLLLDRDVASYYPSIILGLGLEPQQMAGKFLPVYQSIVERRLAAKHAGDKVTADTLKIVVNGSFGKFGSKYSDLYAPDLMIRVTLTGQLALLMLIEWLETAGIQVVSANTDGIVIKCPAARQRDAETIVWEWELLTGFVTEETRYAALYSRDVNNYIAIKAGGGAKLKGVYAGNSLAKNPTNQIVVDAVLARLVSGHPVEQTVAECGDIRKFLTIRSVKGGAVKDGIFLGKAVRWYQSTACPGPITYKTNGNAVAGSDGGRPMMEIVEGIPDDIDRPWYVTEAHGVLRDIGVGHA